VNLIVPAAAQDWLNLASQEPLEHDSADHTDKLLVARYEVLVNHGGLGNSIPYALALLRRGMYCWNINVVLSSHLSDLSARDYQNVLRIFRCSLSIRSLADRASAITACLPPDALGSPSAEDIQLLHIILSSLDSRSNRIDVWVHI